MQDINLRGIIPAIVTPMTPEGELDLPALKRYAQWLAEQGPVALAVNVDTCYPSMALMKSRIQANFGEIDPSGKAGAECWADYRQKLEKWHAHRKDFESTLKDWDAVCARLAEETRSPQVILEILQATGAPVRWSQLQPAVQEEQARFAFMNAPLMRKRLTLGDLLVFTDWDRERIWEGIWNLYA